MSVAAAIAAYRSAVEADEALFNADGDLLVSAAEADASEKACKATWMDLMSASCLSPATHDDEGRPRAALFASTGTRT